MVNKEGGIGDMGVGRRWRRVSTSPPQKPNHWRQPEDTGQKGTSLRGGKRSTTRWHGGDHLPRATKAGDLPSTPEKKIVDKTFLSVTWRRKEKLGGAAHGINVTTRITHTGEIGKEEGCGKEKGQKQSPAGPSKDSRTSYFV